MTKKFKKKNTRGGQSEAAKLTVLSFGKDGRLHVTGSADLKGPQAYPLGFGEAITNLRQDNQRHIKEQFLVFKKQCEQMHQDRLPNQKKTWRDADIESVLNEFQQEIS